MSDAPKLELLHTHEIEAKYLGYIEKDDSMLKMAPGAPAKKAFTFEVTDSKGDAKCTVGRPLHFDPEGQDFSESDLEAVKGKNCALTWEHYKKETSSFSGPFWKIKKFEAL